MLKKDFSESFSLDVFRLVNQEDIKNLRSQKRQKNLKDLENTNLVNLILRNI
jgi:hypothetical protein